MIVEQGVDLSGEVRRDVVLGVRVGRVRGSSIFRIRVGELWEDMASCTRKHINFIISKLMQGAEITKIN